MIVIIANQTEMVIRCTCELDGTDECTGSALCYVPMGYLAGRQEPNYPVPAISLAGHWDLVCNAKLDYFIQGFGLQNRNSVFDWWSGKYWMNEKTDDGFRLDGEQFIQAVLR